MGDPPDDPDDGPDPTDPVRPAILRGTHPREILARLVESDSLEIAGRCRARLEERALLIDPQRTYCRALARVAFDAIRWRGKPPLAEFLGRAIDRTLDDLLLEDAEVVTHGIPDAEQLEERHRFVADLLGLELSLAPRACVTFNGLPDAQRRVWWAVCVDREPLSGFATRARSSVDLARQNLRATIQALSRVAGRPFPFPAEADK